MKVVRHKITGRLIHREIPDFQDGKGITSALTFYDFSEDELEEATATLAEWEAELALRKEENLPHSEHIGKLISVNVSVAKPATIRRKYLGDTYDVDCFVTQTVKDQYQAGDIQINDYVVVSFIDENPDDEERNIAIVTDKIYKSWS